MKRPKTLGNAGLSESECDEILKEMEEAEDSHSWQDHAGQIKESIKDNPWPWVIGAGVLLFVIGGRR